MYLLSKNKSVEQTSHTVDTKYYSVRNCVAIQLVDELRYKT